MAQADDEDVDICLFSDRTVDWFEDVDRFLGSPTIIVPRSTIARWQANSDAYYADEQERRRLYEAARNHN